MANSGSGKSDRFYQNPILRDEEWNRAKQLPWWLTVLAIAIIGTAFFVGVYGAAPLNAVGWVVGVLMIVIYSGFGWARRRQAKRRLREAHGQAPS